MLRFSVFVLACSLLMAGCSTTQPVPAVISRPVEVKIPVPVPCISAIPAGPDFMTDRVLLQGSGAQVFDKVWADHKMRQDYEGELLAALTACIEPQKSPQ